MLKLGTDGVRGVANLDLTPEVVLALGRAAARVLGGCSLVVGRDTRQSGPLLEPGERRTGAAPGQAPPAELELVRKISMATMSS